MTASREERKRDQRQYRFLKFRGCRCVYDQRASPLKRVHPKPPYVAQSAEGRCPYCRPHKGPMPR